VNSDRRYSCVPIIADGILFRVNTKFEEGIML
jgi:hypothetical protein